MSFPRYPDYRDTGVQWLGEIPSHWPVYALKRGFQIQGGTTPSADDVNWNGPIQWATPTDLSGLSSLYLRSTKRTLSRIGMASCGCSMLPAGSIILSTRAPIGSLAINTEPMTTNQGCKGLVPNDSTDTTFFAYVLSISKALLNNLGKGTTFLELSGDELGRFQSMFPPVLEQTQIARFLNHETAKIDALIREQERLIELLQEKRQAVISHAVTKGLDPDVPMEDSGVEWLGEVPAHWKVMPVKFLVSFVTSGSRGWADFYSDSGELFFRITNLTRDSIRPKLESIQYVTPPDGSEGSRAKINVGDILVSITADLGSVCAADKSIEGGYVSQHVALARPIATLCNSNWLAYFILGNAAKEQLLGSGYGGTKVQLSLEDIRELVVAVPPTDEQISIAQMLDKRLQEMEALISEAKAAMALLSERRSALISAAVTGKIDVRNWQPPVDESAFDEEVRQAGMEATA